MPRPQKSAEVPSIHKNPPVRHPTGHTIVVYADNAIWDETAGKFISPEDVVRKG